MKSNEIELRNNIVKALDCGRYLITVTRVEENKFSAQEPATLQHYSIMKDFPKDDIIPTFEKLLVDVEKNMTVTEENTEDFSDFQKRIIEED